MDNVVAYQLVLPSGKAVEVTALTYPDLFFGLKGGFNNYVCILKISSLVSITELLDDVSRVLSPSSR